MLKKSLFLATMVLLTTVFSGCGKKDDTRRFTVGFDADFKPYGYVENNQYTGFDIDLAHIAIAEIEHIQGRQSEENRVFRQSRCVLGKDHARYHERLLPSRKSRKRYGREVGPAHRPGTRPDYY